MTRTDVMERRTRVVELSQAGMTDDEIAAKLGYANRSGVWKARQRVLSDHQAESVEDYRAMELLRLDALQLAVWDDAMAGDPRAVAEVRNIISMRMRLLGLDSGKPDGKPAGGQSLVLSSFWDHARRFHPDDWRACRCPEIMGVVDEVKSAR